MDFKPFVCHLSVLDVQKILCNNKRVVIVMKRLQFGWFRPQTYLVRFRRMSWLGLNEVYLHM